MGCMPSKNAQVNKISTPNSKISPSEARVREDKLSSAKAHILDSIKRADPILFEKTMHTYQIRPTEVIGQADQKRTILHYIAESNFAEGMTLALEFILHDQPNQASQALNIKDVDGNTPAMLCCLYDSVETLEILMKSGHVNLNAKNNMGHNAQHIAYENDSPCLSVLSQSNPGNTRETARTIAASSQLSQTLGTPKIPSNVRDEINMNNVHRGSIQLRSIHSIKKEFKLSPDTKLYQVLNDLMATNTNFIDEEFPHDNESIAVEELVPQYLNEYGELKWLRPNEFLNCDFKALSLFEGVDINQVSHSPLAGSDLYSAFAAMTEFPQRLLRVFTTKEVNKHGAYSVKFLVAGTPIEILLDDYVPCLKNSKPLFSRPSNGEIWFCLLEKAFAKLYGNYSELITIQNADALQLITGMPSAQHSLKNISVDDLWNLLLEFDKKNYIYCAGNAVKDNQKNNRIFSVARLCETEQHRLIKLKNHLEDFVWKGDFSDGSELWTKELKDEVGHYTGEKSCFYMDVKEFASYFDFISVCYYNENLIRHGEEASCYYNKAVFFEVDVEREMEVFISVHQKLSRFVDDSDEYDISPVEILVAEALSGDVVRKVASGEQDSFVGKQTVYAEDKIKTKLSEGKYIIRVKVRWVDCMKHDFTLNIFSPYAVTLKKVKAKRHPNFLERVYLDAGARAPDRYQLGNKCEFGSSWCGSHLWLYGTNKGNKTWNLEICFNKIENLKLCKKYRTSDNILKLVIPPKGEAVAYAKRINSKNVEINWTFNQSWS